MERCSGIEPDRDAVLQTAAFPFRQHLKLVVRQGFEPCMSVCKTDAFPSWRTDHCLVARGGIEPPTFPL